jgi:hypothetical protein
MKFLSQNNHIVVFIMKILCWIQVPIDRSKDILIIICISINGTHGKNIVSSPKWAIIPCIYPLGSFSKQEEEQETLTQIIISLLVLPTLINVIFLG